MLPEPSFSWLHWLYVLFRDNDEKALFLLLLIEEAGVPLPMPGDLLIMFAGYRAATGEMTVLESGLASTLAVLMGSTILYSLSNRFGHGLLFRYGRLVHLDERRLKLIESWIQKRGPIMVLVGRLTPGLRTPTSIMAGVFRIPFPQFLLFAGLSALLWSCFWLGLGFYGGRTLMPLVRQYTHYSYYAAGILASLVAVGLLAYRWWGAGLKRGAGKTKGPVPAGSLAEAAAGVSPDGIAGFSTTPPEKAETTR